MTLLLVLVIIYAIQLVVIGFIIYEGDFKYKKDVLIAAIPFRWIYIIALNIYTEFVNNWSKLK